MLLGPGHADVAQPSLFFQPLRLFERPGVGEQPLLQAGQEDDGELQPFGAVQRHQRDAVDLFLPSVEVGDQRQVLQERVQPLLAGDVFKFFGDRHQLPQVLQPAVGFVGAFRLQHRLIPGLHDRRVDQVGGPDARGAVAQPRDQIDEFCRGALRGFGKVLQCLGLGHRLQHTEAVAPGVRLQPPETNVSDAAPGHVDDARQAGVVGRYQGEPQVGDNVPDLFALIEAHPAHDRIGDAGAQALFFKQPGLRVGAVEDHEVAIAQPVPEARDLIDHKARLIVPVEGLIEDNRLAGGVGGPQRLAVSVRVVLDDLPRGLQDGLGGAIVLFELHDGGIEIVLFEFQDVAHVGTTPPVDRLVIISHHADVAVLFREGADDEILRAVGILVFVDEDVLEAILILLFDVRRLAKQSHDLQQQVVKIQGVLLPQRALVSVKDARYDLLIPAVGPFRVGEVVDAFVFGPIDQGEDDGRREAALVQPQVFQALADHGPLVVLVEDQEVPPHAHAVAVPAEDPAADVVESTDPDRPRHRRPDQPVDALPHLVGRFVGEGHRQDAGRRNALVAQQVSHPVGQHPRLAATGTSQDQQRAAGVRDRFSLGRVQVLEQIHTWRSVYRTNTTYTTYTIYTITSKPFSTKFVSSGGCVGCVVCVG